MPKAALKDVATEILACGLCGAEQPRARMGIADRGFSVRQGPSRIHVTTAGEEPCCLDFLGCIERAVKGTLGDAIYKVEQMEASRIIREREEAEANKAGKTTHERTDKTVRGKRMVRR